MGSEVQIDAEMRELAHRLPSILFLNDFDARVRPSVEKAPNSAIAAQWLPIRPRYMNQKRRAVAGLVGMRASPGVPPRAPKVAVVPPSSAMGKEGA